MNKRGVAIIFSFLAITLLLGFLGALFVQAMGETRLVQRQAHSVNALWLAEAGIAKVKSVSGAPANASGTIVNPSDLTDNVYSFNAVATQIGTSDYYTVVSTGTVTSPGSVIRRVVSVTMKNIPPDASKFQYCVETTGNEVSYKAKNVVNLINPANLVKVDSTQAFSDLFGVDMSAMKAQANIQLTNPTSNTIDASGITWVDVTQGDPPSLSIQHLNGSGIVVINGNFRLNGVAGGGGSTFNGILYVVGKFWMSGNATVNGTVFVESTADIDDTELTGSSLVKYSPQYIAASLGTLSSKTVVSWKEN